MIFSQELRGPAQTPHVPDPNPETQLLPKKVQFFKDSLLFSVLGENKDRFFNSLKSQKKHRMCTLSHLETYWTF